jgi:hypothetical protein
MCLCTINLAVSSETLLSGMEVHVGVREVLELLGSNSRVLIFLVLIGENSSHCL